MVILTLLSEMKRLLAQILHITKFEKDATSVWWTENDNTLV